MLMEHSMIDDQLAIIAATVGSVKHPHDQDTHDVLSKIFLCWLQSTRRQESKVGAQDRTWCSMRTQRTLVKSIAKWGTWLKGNRLLGAQRAERETTADAYRSGVARVRIHVVCKGQPFVVFSSLMLVRHNYCGRSSRESQPRVKCFIATPD